MEARILKQVEFYFSNANLTQDKFLSDQINKDNGWVQISVLMTFSRLKALSEDPELVAAALQKSKELLEVNAEGTAVRRAQPMETRNFMESTLCIKGFPDSVTLDCLESYFENQSLPFEAIRMKKINGSFNGSVFVTFKSRKEAERAFSLSYEGRALLVQWKEDYLKKGPKKISDEAVIDPRSLVKIIGEIGNVLEFKERLKPHMPVKFVKMTGEKVAIVRLETPIADTKYGSLVIDEKKYEVLSLSEDEIKAFEISFKTSLKGHKKSRH